MPREDKAYLWNAMQLKAENVPIEALAAIANFMILPEHKYGVQCRECKTILANIHVRDPGVFRHREPSCSDCGLSCAENQKKFGKPIALADSLVPGSLVFAPIRGALSAASGYAWPAIVDYSPDKESTFCELDKDGKPEKYFVTFILGGHQWYGGWFEDRALILFDESRNKFPNFSYEFENALRRCRRRANLSLGDRLKHFSFLGHLLLRPAKDKNTYTEEELKKLRELSPSEIKAGIKKATSEFFTKHGKDPSRDQVWPSAAARIVHLTSHLQAIRENPSLASGGASEESLADSAKQSSDCSSKRSNSCEWTKNPFRDITNEAHQEKRPKTLLDEEPRSRRRMSAGDAYALRKNLAKISPRTYKFQFESTLKG